jgi:hypothetical protein
VEGAGGVLRLGKLYSVCVTISGNEVVALIVAVSFAAGLNVYATTGTLGLLGHFGLVQLPPQLHLLDSWWIIGASAVLFTIEFFADKVPAFDLIWNALHTFIRVPVAALLAYGATSHLSPDKQLLATLVGGLIALAAQGAKTGVAVSLTWFATRHPYWAAAIVLVMLVVIVVLIRWVVRAVKALFRGAERAVAG